MSTDLELYKALPPTTIQLQAMKIIKTANSQFSDDDDRAAEIIDPQLHEAAAGNDGDDHQEEFEQECPRTPTSKEHKIPAILSCPPAPRKPRHAVSCKRKLSSQLDFFEIVHRQEVEEFFRSSFKRSRCPAM